MPEQQGLISLPSGEIKCRIWAPKAKTLDLLVLKNGDEIKHPMKPGRDGFFECTLPNETLNGSKEFDYLFLIDGQNKRPDPLSRWQPQGIHGPSRSNLQNFSWTDQNWKGIPLEQYLIYELHIGTFTLEGTFEAAIQHLPYLKELGITAIEIMPPVEFPGNRNWGYDLVYPYAPHHSYGGPNGLKKLINACHETGLAVIMDCVYNHLGHEGNYSDQYGYYTTEQYKTPWGQAINFDGENSDFVRQYAINNALYWLEQFHVDALRLDAVHAIFDFGARHILEELQSTFQCKAKSLGRKAYIIAESDLNNVRLLKPLEKGGYALDAQWNDDFHHALHVLLTGSQWRYFSDFSQVSQLAKAITQGFVYDGIWSQFRKKTHGSKSADLPARQFVLCMQNHDQIGNAGLGKRLGAFVDPVKYRLGSMVLFFSPGLPLIFMGQEWNASTPFLFFTNYEDEKLGISVREGYKKEFDLPDDESADPQGEQRFLQSKLKWEEIQKAEHQEVLNLYKELIRLRKECKPLSNLRKDLTKTTFSDKDKWLIVERGDDDGLKAALFANFNDRAQNIPFKISQGNWELKLTNQKMDIPKQIVGGKEVSLSLPGWGACIWILEPVQNL